MNTTRFLFLDSSCGSSRLSFCVGCQSTEKIYQYKRNKRRKEINTKIFGRSAKGKQTSL